MHAITCTLGLTPSWRLTEQTMLKTPHILIVDDQLSNLIATEQSLPTLQASIFKASSAEGALALLVRHEIDCILLDASMPQMDGFEFLKILQNDPVFKAIPVLMITGRVLSENSATLAYQLGAFDFLIKPVDYVQLTQKVHRLSHYSLRLRQFRHLETALNQMSTSITQPIKMWLEKLYHQQPLSNDDICTMKEALSMSLAIDEQWRAITHE
jgi:response regulator RpfG family c-di-GMP phosphodiesterase